MIKVVANSSKVLLYPFYVYNDLLERRPLLIKSLTSGVMYSGGDVLAQYTENYNNNKDKAEEDKVPLNISLKRCWIFFVYGTVIGGPAYHYWFNYLNELPALLWRMKQSRQRGSILRAYALLKSYNIEVKLDLAKLPKAEPLSKWKGKAAKILADQLIFSSTYTLIFFLSIGMLNGALDRWEVEYFSDEQEPVTENDRAQHFEELIDKLQEYTSNKAIATKKEDVGSGADTTQALPLVASEVGPITDKSASEVPKKLEEKVINDLIHKLRTVQMLQARGLSWSEIWQKTWAHTKEVYLDTYLADCAVWPPLQLINFTFIPLRFQFLFVNVANLAWNTFLSLMANKKHG